MAKKTIEFLYGMVVGTFASNRTNGKDWEAAALAKRYKSVTNEDDGVADALSEAVTYTTDLKFNWSDDVPESIRALETFWNMIKAGKAPEDAFKFYSDTVDNVVILGVSERRKTVPVTDAELAELRQIATGGKIVGDFAALVVDDAGRLFKHELVREGTKGWNAATNEALTPWEPPKAWKLSTELTMEEAADSFLGQNGKK